MSIAIGVANGFSGAEASTIPAVDHLTVLTSTTGKFATKQFSLKKDGTVKNRSYGNETYFSVASIPVTDIYSLAAALEKVARNPHAFVIRGKPLPHTNLKRTRRLALADRKTGEPATFEDQELHWFSADIDHIPCPALIDPRIDPEAAVEHAIGLLPLELHDATCWWQFSSSQSVNIGSNGADNLSLHLWFWSAERLNNAALKRWALAANQIAGYKLIGPEFFVTVQAHYIAAPIFTAPLKDPLPRRWRLRRGLDDAVTLLIPPPAPKHPDRPSTDGYQPGRGAQAHMRDIGGPSGFRAPMMKAIASYIASYGSNADLQPLYQAIRAQLDRVEPGWRTDPDGRRYYDDDHLDKMAAWVRHHHGDQPPKVKIPPPWFDENTPPPPLDSDSVTAAPELSDDALALLYSRQYRADLRYVALWGKWLLWRGSHWSREETLLAFDFARTLCRTISINLTGNAAGDISSAKTIAAVERLARSDRRQASTYDQWNSDDWLLNPPTKEDK